MTANDPMPFGKHKGMPIKDVPQEYKDWLLKQEGFEKNHAELCAVFKGQPPSAKETQVDAEEDLILTTAPQEFQDWWWAQHGKNLRKHNSDHYIAHLRIALGAWRAGVAYQIFATAQAEQVTKPKLKPVPTKPTTSDEPPQF